MKWPLFQPTGNTQLPEVSLGRHLLTGPQTTDAGQGGSLFDEFAVYELAGAVVGQAEQGADEVALVSEAVGVEDGDAHTDCAA